MKTLTSLLTLTLLLVHTSAASADWSYDFDDGTIPEGFTTFTWDIDWQNSTNVSMDAGDGTLRVWDSDGLSPYDGGTKEFDWIGPEVFDGNVRVSAEINSSGDTDDMPGLLLALAGDHAQGGYWATLSFDQRSGFAGQLATGKGGAWGVWRDLEPLTDLDRSYFMEMELTDREAHHPLITTRVFDSRDGELLIDVSYRDLDYNNSLPYRPLQAGIIAFTNNNDPLNTSFDNVAAVPEPSTFALLAMAAVGLLAHAWRKRRR